MIRSRRDAADPFDEPPDHQRSRADGAVSPGILMPADRVDGAVKGRLRPPCSAAFAIPLLPS